MTIEQEQEKLQTLFDNLAMTTGQLEVLKEQLTTIRTEIAKVQGRLEALAEVKKEKQSEEITEANP